MQTKSQEAMNRKHPATRMPERLRAKHLLPKNFNSRRGKAASQKKSQNRRRSGNQNGPRASKLQRNEVIERGIPGFRALKYRARLAYYDVVTVTSGAGTVGAYVYSANGLYDPDITSTGHQPMPFDQLMLSFEHYTVTQATLKAVVRNNSTTTSTAVALSLNAGSAPATSYIQVVENGNLVRDTLSFSPYDNSIKTLSIPISISRFGGVPTLLDNPDYKGTVAANPAEQSYFHIQVWNPDSLAVVSVNVQVYIDYWAVFTEPRENSPSLMAAMKRMILAEEKERPVTLRR